MSTITKEELISYVLEGRRSWNKIIEAYCLEFEKKQEDIDKLLAVLPLFPIVQRECYNIALDYFFIKYEITILRDKKDRIIMIY